MTASTKTETQPPTKTKNTKPFVIAGVALIAAIWAGVIAALVILQPAIKTKAVILAVGAGSTELIIYAGAAWFGVNLFKRLRDKLRLRRS